MTVCHHSPSLSSPPKCLLSPPHPPSLQAYALSRDRGLPFSSLLRRLSPWGVPSNAIVLAGLIATVLNLPLLIGNSAYYAVVGTATTAWFTAYSIPIIFRILAPHDKFPAGPFALAKVVGRTGR